MDKVLAEYRTELKGRIHNLRERMQAKLDAGDVESRHYLAGQVLAYEYVIDRIGKMLVDDTRKNGGKRK